ncbi:hypothetical protein [Winogradskyella flava]|uniref:hypothetical protein n=1 Tax=Winogradskyella flava TaxID=1884876 RepID=UPI002491D4E9|nr:hypothetical protein [Winogradskyella flava]
MKSIKISTFFTFLCLLLSANCDSQVNLKSAKNAVKSKVKTEAKSKTKTKQTTMSADNPCDTNGTVKITEGNKAFTSYKNCLKQLEVAERNVSKGINAETAIKMAKRNMLSILKKEPNADLSEICQRFQKIEQGVEALLPKPKEEVYDACKKGSGTVKLKEGDKGFKEYESALEEVLVAERYILGDSRNFNTDHTTSVQNAIDALIRVEPNADVNELCSRMIALRKSPESIKNLAKYFDEQKRIVKTVYFDKSEGVYPEELGLENPDWFLKRMHGFNREELLSKAKASPHENAIEILEILDDYSTFLDRQGVSDYLMDQLDQYNNASSDQLMKKAKEINSVAKALKNLAGNNAGMDRVIAFTQKQLGKADSALANIYSSDIHKEYINQVVFTKQPFKPGGEGGLEINPTFNAGDAVYATVYLSVSIKDAVDSWKGSGKGGTMGLKVKNSNGDFLNRKFEAWEVSSYSNYEVSISDGTNKEQTIVQFVLIPNKDSSIKTEMTCKNITPILMARGLSLESERLKEYKVEVSSSGQVTGSMTYKGSFKIDLATGQGPSYYNEVENQKMETLLASVPLPTAKINNPNLEAQLLAEMKKQGFQEQFKKVYIQTNWQLIEPPLQDSYKEMTASFTHTTADGKCGWQNYSFRSLKTGSSWSGPQKWGGANQRQRMSCKKIK